MVTIDVLVNALWEVYITKNAAAAGFNQEQRFMQGRTNGWLEEQDCMNIGMIIERRSAARIIHEFVRSELKLQDTRDWSNANKLKDLYDCRVCAKHVAQVVERNIMKPQEPGRFMLLRPFTENELQEAISRIKVISETA